ncbi:MAG: branched-chain amino acid ABC transporter permease [Firmicutes bacterium]|nr:branched-chain amino acid ABC transporter permease [Bacillota bacterium]
MNILKNKPIQYILLGLIIAITPFIFNFQRGTLTMFNTVIIYSIVAIGFNILLGYAGQISLGHAAFMGLGAYISGYLTNMGIPFILSILIAGVIPMIIGLILGLVALRLEGHYLAIATLGFGVTIQQIFKEWTSFTNGYSGMRGQPASIFGFSFRSRESFFVLAIVILVLLSIFAYNLLKSKTGRALIAMRDSEHAAQAMGISLLKYKLIAFSISAFYAGIAGSLYIHLIRFIEPNQWGVELSLNLLAMVVIGGLASIEGSIIGAFFLTVIPDILKEIPMLGEIRNLSTILTGVSLILVIMFLPLGIARINIQIKEKLNNKNTKKTALNQ